MPGSGAIWPPPKISAEDRESIEEIFDHAITDETWRRLKDALCNHRADFSGRVSVKEWKKRNATLKRRLKMQDEPVVRDEVDAGVFRFAYCNHAHETTDPWQAVNLMQKELAADQKRYECLKAEGRLYEKDELGQPVHGFCWIEYPRLPTEAVISCAGIFEDAGLSTALTHTRFPERDDDDGRIVPTPFEVFCFEFLFNLTVEQVLEEAEPGDNRIAKDTFRRFQQIRDLLSQRGKLAPKK